MRIVPLLIYFFTCVFVLPAQGQNCGCADEGNCPAPIPANNSTQICYEITDAFNNDLSDPAQGICGISVNFRHNLISDLDMTLIAPDGTQVQLTGTNGNCNTLTPIANWDILFLPCGETCEPDTVNCALPCIFDNCPPGCNWPNANLTGSYHPFSGCLEDFNTGPVNGQWCLQLDNNAQFNTGNLLDFQIFLCDESGILCCEADAGNLAFEPDVNACEGDSALQLTPNPLYGAVVPDSLEYGYNYAVFSNGSFLQYDSLTDLRTYPTGTYQVCGLSYLLNDSTSLPSPGEPVTAVDIYNNLTGPTPDFCGNIDTNCILVNISAPPLPTSLTDTICTGDTVFIGSSAYTTTGMYADTIDSYGGCDSTVSLDLTVLLPDTSSLTETICFNENYVVGTDTFSSTGMYEVQLQNYFGCDSTVMLDLTVLNPIETNLTDTICLGDTVWIGATPFFNTGLYTENLTSFNNCDSTVNLDLTVVEVTVSITPPDTLTCLQTTIDLTAVGTTTHGTLNYQWTTSGGNFTGFTNTSTVEVDAPGIYHTTVQSAGCSATDSVEVIEDTAPPTAVALSLSPDTLTCAILSVELDGSNSTGGPNLSYQWTGAVSDPSAPTPTVSSSGTYELLVTNTDNGCTDTDEVTIAQDTLSPVASAGADTTLSCTVPSLELDGTASSPAGNISYTWTAMPGNIVNSPNSATPRIDEPGTYQLIVSNLTNACQDTDIVVINIDDQSPVAIIDIPGEDSITCNNPIVTLDGNGSLNTQNATFEWIGNIAGGQGTAVATVNQPGQVSLVVLNTINGCSDTTTISIVENTTLPVADAGMPNDTISCTNINEGLGGINTSIGVNIIYEWTTPDGSIFSPSNAAFITVDSAGTYFLTVTDTLNGCTAIDSATVTGTYEPLQADAGPYGELNCQDTTYLLDGSNSEFVAFASLEWVNSAGTVISTASQVSVDYPDTFTLILNFAFCEDRDTVIVSAGSVPPVADAGPDAQLDCATGQATLDGSGSGTGPDFIYEWTTPDGSLASGENSLMPVVDAVGTYVIMVTDTSTFCSSIDSVVVTIDSIACAPLADAGADGLINCNSILFADTLAANGTTGPNITYQWTPVAPATIINDNDPFAPVVTAGTFIFSVTNETVGLTASDTVMVIADTMPPIADAGPFILSLTCPQLAGCYTVDASNSSQGPNYSYFWESLDGEICSSPSILNIDVLGEGIYNLQVTNNDNGCHASDAVLVQLDDFPVTVSIGNDIQMECGDTDTLIISATASPSGSNLSYQWTSNGGTIVNGANTLTPVVTPNNPQDVFYLTATNTQNLCTDTDSIVVFAPVNCEPACMANASGTIDCNIDTLSLSASGSSTGADITYQWTAITGNLCGGDMTMTACADQAGVYLLTVTRTYPNGANFSTNCQVEVFDASQSPTADAGPDDELNCSDSELFLNGSNSASGPTVVYSWNTSGGNILNGAATPTPEINEPGTYVITVTDTLTGCSGTDTVTIGVDTLAPMADAGPAGLLTCINNTIMLSGSGSPAGISYSWTTQDGNICGDANSSDPLVCAAGTYFLTVINDANGCTATDSTTVDADEDIPVVDVGDNLSYTCADTVFMINATASGNGTLAYQWMTSNGGCLTSPADSLQVTAACPGTYTLTVTDMVNNCTAVGVVEISDDTAPPVANAGSSQEINCQQLQVMLDGSASLPAGQLDFSWSTSNGHIVSGETTPMPMVDSAGIYHLLVTDNITQCVDSASVMVTVNADIPIAQAGPDTTLTCTRTILTLDGSASTSGPNIIYSWNGPGIISGENSTQPQIGEPGAYTLQVTDTSSLCVVEATVVVSLDTISPIAIIGNGQSPTINCAENQVILNGLPSMPVDSVSWQWSTQGGHISTGTNTANAVADSAGVYLLTVTHDRTGCTDEASITVNEDFEQPFIQFAEPPKLTCDSTTVQLEVYPPGLQSVYTYAWEGPGQITGDTTTTPTVDAAGLYSVTITDTSNGCENDSILLVTQNLSVPEAVASTSGTLDCDNLTATVTGMGSTTDNVTYQWTTTSGGNINAPNALTTQVDAAGWYYLTVRKLDNGCTHTDSTEVTANSLPISDALISLDHPDCEDPEGFIFIDSVIGGTPPYFYSLAGDVFITYPQFSFLDPGAYELVIEDVNGCAWETTVSLFYPNEVLVELGDDMFVRLGESAELEAQVNLTLEEIGMVNWENIPDTTECPNCLDQIVFPVETTTYRVVVYDTTGCWAMDDITIFVNEEHPFFIPTAFSPNGDNNNDRLVFYASKDVDNVPAFAIFDRWGNIVFQAEDLQPNDPNYGWDGNFEGQPMNPAVFVWKAEVAFVNGTSKVFYGEVTLVR